MDDLQPQDLSSVVDLTRSGEAASLDAMRMVSPRWYPDSGTGRTGLPLTDAASSDVGVRSGDQVRSDNAFSNTTVTLSYVSRSHVFSSQDSLSSTRSSLYSVPSLGKFSLQSSCESENGHGDTGYALSQHYLQHSDGPLDLATRTQLFQALSQTQVAGEKNDESQLCPTQPGSRGLSLENGGQPHNWPTSGHSSSPDVAEPQGSGPLGSSELLRVTGTQEPSVFGEAGAGAELPSLGTEYDSSPEDPGSASAVSPDQVSIPSPQASRPPSAVNSCPEQADAVIWDALDTENPIEPFPSEQAESSGDCTRGLEASTEPTSAAHKRKVAPQPTGELTHRGEFLTNVSARKPQKNAKMDSAVVPHINGNAKTLPGNTPPRRKLPERVGRGTRLEALVLNLCPSAYKVADCVHTGKTTSKAAKKTAVPSKSSSAPGKEDHAIGRPKKASASAETKRKAASPSKVGKTDRVITDNCKDSTSDCEILNNSKNLHNGTPSKTAASPFSAQGKSKPVSSVSPQQCDPDVTARQRLNLEPGEIPFPDTLPEAEVKVRTPTNSPKKSPSASKISPTKAARPPRKRRKNPAGGHPSSMFSPQEPEIKLKYINYKEERRDPRLDSFSPLVRAHRQPASSSCLYAVINYAEEDSTRQGGQQQGSSGGFLSGATPGTSCLRPGRVSIHGQQRRSLVCCLCGASANAPGLGDLHGPYYPDGYRPTGKTKASVSSPKTNAEEEEEEGGDKDDSSDSDSSVSSCSMRGAGGRRRARPPPGAWPQRGGVHLQQKGALASPAAKRARMESSGMLAEEEDWYSPPVVPHEPCEYWLHEDCSIWAAGVFLVKGKVYGLEEAVKVAQATMCSGCRSPGATLGCLFKGCPNKYHYRCAVEHDCVLVEENFSMKCKKHKNKSLKAR